ncbi:uncharacterized protein LOC128869377 isoform X2 [Anastrepha ludens]|uniref:uncharacterized protein LOC128869377 isoform X2 n=1 Tax=Anastrepha ludens TaxID=28586 RepID=UPI0023AF5B13|nr:uncharacterized protein LOC128869377 isoform X2 [Anastrepha ludens]
MHTTRKKCKNIAAKPNVTHSKKDDEKPTTSKKAAAANEIARKHFSAALVDRGSPLGQMSQEPWKLSCWKLSSPTFDGSGWFSGVKIIKCKDDRSLTWVMEVVNKLQGLWEGDAFEIVDCSSVPSIPKAKVFILRTVSPEHALRLLQMQNKDVPTDDWKGMKVAKSANANESQNYILQINKTAEEILYVAHWKRVPSSQKTQPNGLNQKHAQNCRDGEESRH